MVRTLGVRHCCVLGVLSLLCVLEPTFTQDTYVVVELRVAIDSTFALSDAAVAFERSLASGKHGKVVILSRSAP